MIKKRLINSRDSRGIIVDIFENEPKEHCTLVTFKRKAVRGNHFHKKTVQYSFVLDGELEMYTCRVNKIGNYIGKKKKKIVKKYDLIKHNPFVAHAFKALKKSDLLAFADGKRGGKNYEKDTFRLKIKLIK